MLPKNHVVSGSWNWLCAHCLLKAPRAAYPQESQAHTASYREIRGPFGGVYMICCTTNQICKGPCFQSHHQDMICVGVCMIYSPNQMCRALFSISHHQLYVWEYTCIYIPRFSASASTSYRSTNQQ